MLTMFNFVYTGENFGDVIFTDSTSGLATVFFVIVSFLGNLVVLSQLVGSFQNYYGLASEKAQLLSEAKERARRRQGYLCVYAQLAVSEGRARWHALHIEFAVCCGACDGNLFVAWSW